MTNIETINTVINILLKISLVVLVFIIVLKLYKFFTTKYNDIKNKELDNEKIKLYSSIDPKLVKQELIQLIRDYTARYVTKNIMVNNIEYIKDDQIDEMVKSIVKDVVLEMSDLYLSYCKLLYNIESEDDLLKVIYYLTVDIVLDVVTNINKIE